MLISISFIFLFTFFENETKTGTSDVDVYEVINYVSETRNKTPKNKYISENLSLLNEKELASISLIFSIKDLEFINEQNKKRLNFKLNQKLITNGTVIPNATLIQMKKNGNLWEKFKKKYHEEKLLTISLPIFSKDKKSSLVTTSTICGTCINRETSVYKKVNGKWKLDKQLYTMQM